jgi:hypothetical protein
VGHLQAFEVDFLRVHPLQAVAQQAGTACFRKTLP